MADNLGIWVFVSLIATIVWLLYPAFINNRHTAAQPSMPPPVPGTDGPIETSDEIANTVASMRRDQETDGQPILALSKTTIFSLIVFALVLVVAISQVICSRSFGESTTATELMILFAVAFWTAIPRISSDTELLKIGLFVFAQLLIVLLFAVQQSVDFFWLTLLLFLLTVFSELAKRLDNDLFTRVFQVATILLSVTLSFVGLTILLFPTMQPKLYAQFDWAPLLAVRGLILTAIIAIATVAIIGRAVNRFRAQWRSWLAGDQSFMPTQADRGYLFQTIVAALIDIWRLLGSFFRTLGTVAIKLLQRVLLNWPLWKGLLRGLLAFGCLAILVAAVRLIHPSLTEVLRNSAPFFNPGGGIIQSYAYLIVGFCVAWFFVGTLLWLSLPEHTLPQNRRSRGRSLTLTTLVLLLCLWSATALYWATNVLIYTLHTDAYVLPGYFMIAFPIVGTLAAIQFRRQLKPPAEVSMPD